MVEFSIDRLDTSLEGERQALLRGFHEVEYILSTDDLRFLGRVIAEFLASNPEPMYLVRTLESRDGPGPDLWISHRSDSLEFSHDIAEAVSFSEHEASWLVPTMKALWPSEMVLESDARSELDSPKGEEVSRG